MNDLTDLSKTKLLGLTGTVHWNHFFGSKVEHLWIKQVTDIIFLGVWEIQWGQTALEKWATNSLWGNTSIVEMQTKNLKWWQIWARTQRSNRLVVIWWNTLITSNGEPRIICNPLRELDYSFSTTEEKAWYLCLGWTREITSYPQKQSRKGKEFIRPMVKASFMYVKLDVRMMLQHLKYAL
jgi:hypothetical protein